MSQQTQTDEIMVETEENQPDETLEIRHHFEVCKVCDGDINVFDEKTPDGLTTAECKACGLLFVQSIPESKLWSDDSLEATLAYYDNHYDGVPDKFPYGLKLIQKQMAKQDDSYSVNLLDVGCGRGDFLSLAQEAGYTVSGLEMSRGAIELCKQRGFEKIYYGDLNATDEVFDVVSLFDVVEHIEDLNPFFNDLRNRIKDNGLVYIEVPRKCLTDQYLKLMSLVSPIRNNRVSREHVQLYSDQSLKTLLKRNGFDVVHFETRMSLSWKDKKPYIRNMGIRFEPLVSILDFCATVALSLGLLGYNKAIVLAKKK